MGLPERIKVTATIDSVPLDGVLLLLRIVTTFKNDFNLLFGPTDNHGELVITRAEMIEGAGRDQEMSPMDYGDPEIHFAGELAVSVFNREKLKRSVAGQEIFLDVAVEEGANVLVRTETEY